MKAATAYLSKQNPLMLAAGAALLVGLLYFLARKTVSDAAKAAGGIISGDNAVTRGTAYEGAGILGTLGGTVNAALPFLDNLGSWTAGLLASDSAGESLYYTVQFPDGARHAVPSLSVERDGRFTYKGTKYVLGMQGTTRVARYAQ